MVSYLMRRVLVLLPLLLGISLLLSALIYIIPGDPARVILGPDAREEAVQRLRERLDLDKPFYERYGMWLLGALRGDLGRSWKRNEPVAKMIADRIPASLELAFVAAILGFALHIPISVIAAVKRNSIVDNAIMFGAFFWISMPDFWLGIMIILLVAVKLRLFPISGRSGPLWTADGWRYLVLPAFVLTTRLVATLSRLTRIKMIEVLEQDYIRTAWSKGLSGRKVVLKHALRNTMIPAITVFGLQIPRLIGATVIIETVFAWPGIGKLLVDAVLSRDFPLAQGIMLVFAVVVVVVNLLVDVAYAYVDPRIHYE